MNTMDVTDETKYAIIDNERKVIARFVEEPDRDLFFHFLKNYKGDNYGRVIIMLSSNTR